MSDRSSILTFTFRTRWLWFTIWHPNIMPRMCWQRRTRLHALFAPFPGLNLASWKSTRRWREHANSERTWTAYVLYSKPPFRVNRDNAIADVWQGCVRRMPFLTQTSYLSKLGVQHYNAQIWQIWESEWFSMILVSRYTVGKYHLFHITV